MKDLSEVLKNPFETHPQKLYTEDQLKQAHELGKIYLVEVLKTLDAVTRIDGTEKSIAQSYHTAFIITQEIVKILSTNSHD